MGDLADTFGGEAALAIAGPSSVSLEGNGIVIVSIRGRVLAQIVFESRRYGLTEARGCQPGRYGRKQPREESG